MKLKRLKINTPYKSLQPGFEIKFKPNLNSTNIDPLCFVGPNGSGKSNVLEAIADIFYFLECDIIGYTSVAAFKTPIKAFEIEYYKPLLASSTFVYVSDDINSSSTSVTIKIIKEYNSKPRYILITESGEREIEKDFYTHVLPKKIWAYSSGENETLSIPFLRMDLFYLEKAEINLKNNINEIVNDNRLHYIDYETTGSLILANFLMSQDTLDSEAIPNKKLDLFNNKFGIESIDSFRITIRFKYRNKFNLPIDKTVQTFIKTLEENFTHNERLRDNDPLIINVDLKRAENIDVFKKLAADASSLYRYFEKLLLRNKYTIPWKRRQDVLYSEDIFEAHNNLVKVPDDELLFTIDSLMLKMKDIDDPIPYKSISDGEHQALTIFSLINLIDEDDVLCLFDEPETHLNPKWKYEYISTINKIQKQKDSQIFITTHDPIFISGLSKEQVILFNKRIDIAPDQKRWSFSEEDLKGKGVDAILTSEIFNLSTTLDQETLNKLIERRKLLLLLDKKEINIENFNRLKVLNEELNDIDFNKPFDDPLYKEFIKAIDNLDDYTRINLTEEEKEERQSISNNIIKKLNDQFPE